MPAHFLPLMCVLLSNYEALDFLEEPGLDGSRLNSRHQTLPWSRNSLRCPA